MINNLIMSRRKLYDYSYSQGGFTLVEMIAVISILAILLSASAVGIASWAGYSRYTNAQNCAEEIFLSLETVIAKRNSEVCSGISDEIRSNGIRVKLPSGEEIYSVSYYQSNDKTNFLPDLLKPTGIVPEEECNSILCEFVIDSDSDNVSVFAVFTSENTLTFVYGDSNSDDEFNIFNRDSGVLKRNEIGSYMVGNSTHFSDLD